MAIHKVKAARSNEWSVRERERDRLQAIYLFVQPKFFLLLIFYINMLEKRSTKLHSHSTYDLNALQRTEIRLQKSRKKRRGEHDEWKKIERTTYTQSWIFFCSPFASSASRFIDLLFLHFLSLLSPVQLFGECHRVLFALLYCSFVCSLFFVCFCFIHFVVFQLHFVQMDRHDWSEQVSEWSERKVRDFMLWLRFIPAGKYAHMFQLLSLTEFPL